MRNLTHRGAVDADGKTGDGAGILTQIPRELLNPVAESMAGRRLDPAELAVGVFFLPLDDRASQTRGKQLVESVVSRYGAVVRGWRPVPLELDVLGEKARRTLPRIFQLLLGKNPSQSPDEFERALFVARRKIEILAREQKLDLYIPSMSLRTISYKGLMLASALSEFYTDLRRPEFKSAWCVFHQRFSTNTFPTWSLGQPFRMLAHNGEINTLRGNRNWFHSRASEFRDMDGGQSLDDRSPHELFDEILDPRDSDSASLDNALQLLVMHGRSLEHAMLILMPPAWRSDLSMTPEQQAFMRFHRCFSEPWDGPAAVVFTDGRTVGACLDRNGLRPLRLAQTADDIFCASSEAGCLELDESQIIKKGRLGPGQMVSIDTASGEIRYSEQIRQQLAERRPYGEWLNQRIELSQHVPDRAELPEIVLKGLPLWQRQVAYAYTSEEADLILQPMIASGREATHSMGDDTPLAILSLRPRLLYHYFSQLFAQVTNPPIDPIRERLVMSIAADLGPEHDLLSESPDHARLIHLDCPILFPHQLAAIKTFQKSHPYRRLDLTWPVECGPDGLERRLDELCEEADELVDEGAAILILSDTKQSAGHAGIPALLATAAIHQHLIRGERRMRCSLILESGEPRDTHQLACLFGYGITAICPYLAFNTVLNRFARDRQLEPAKQAYSMVPDERQAMDNYRQAIVNGLLKIMSKMGISVLNSYQGAQVFEAVGIGSALIRRCFPGTPSQLDGIGTIDIATEVLERHVAAYAATRQEVPFPKLSDPGYIRFRRPDHADAKDGVEDHAVPTVTVKLFHDWVAQSEIKNFHTFAKSNDPDKYAQYLGEIRQRRPVALHDMLEFAPPESSIPLGQVEPAGRILKRFTTAAMSLGALSPEAHETLAIAMNRIGGKSNSGEGGEASDRFNTERNSKIKQIASGRFGVHAEYLLSAEELEIKMAQGAKPGEGGQLPGFKVDALIARLRHTQPGVPLISPPPHHDIYSIEDLAQLIYDLKQINPSAQVCVKLVAETGVGTIAAGVAKAGADVILISGHDGGTGAAPISSIKHAGLPWEIGLAETQQVLMLNGLRNRVRLRTDGGLRNGEDIVKAAILGAEEFNFGTIVLIAMGCVYVRRCHLNTCPVGIATQDPQRRKKFHGQVDHVINYMHAVAEEIREIMASLGVKRLDDLIGRPAFLTVRHVSGHPRANLLDFRKLLTDVAQDDPRTAARICTTDGNTVRRDEPLDNRILLETEQAIMQRQPTVKNYRIRNIHRNIGTRLSGFIASQFGNYGFARDGRPTLTLQLEGSAGQSLGCFLVAGVRIEVKGEANDYVGKGMCGGEIIVRPPDECTFDPAQNTIMGNTVLYGATGGALFANGRAGERFAVRNSGAVGVVEGLGDHGCEYMTAGVVVVLGEIGKNFAAGMSGGEAFVYDVQGDLPRRVNQEMVQLHPLARCHEGRLHDIVTRHRDYTGSPLAQRILHHWESAKTRFVHVLPRLPADHPAEPPPSWPSRSRSPFVRCRESERERCLEKEHAGRSHCSAAKILGNGATAGCGSQIGQCFPAHRRRRGPGARHEIQRLTGQLPAPGNSPVSRRS